MIRMIGELCSTPQHLYLEQFYWLEINVNKIKKKKQCFNYHTLSAHELTLPTVINNCSNLNCNCQISMKKLNTLVIYHAMKTNGS